MKKVILMLLLVLALAIAGCTTTAPAQEPVEQEMDDMDMDEDAHEEIDDEQEMHETDDDMQEEQEQSETKTFVLTGENFKFVMDGEDNPTLKVNQGDMVRVEFTTTAGFHDFVIDEFNAQTAQVRSSDGVTTVEFVADQKGEFEYYCSVGSHRAQGMFGAFIVE